MPGIFSEAFLGQIINEIKKAILDFKKITEKSVEAYPGYMNLKAASKYAGCSDNTFKKFVEYGLPQIQIEDMNPLYAKKDIDDFMFKHKY
ncbi:DNA-binding protein [Latilactobacillus curvatus]|uniref:DNA-binding protein n=1 Tax=Latilactobacillus curvatus TaxID=28038 RepID=UPI0020C74D50|nr:DNA-binding protein [Latilactobacillus curvatus]MCP8858903.1 DNA-binding protein [Latilactobacillus curvatus]